MYVCVYNNKPPTCRVPGIYRKGMSIVSKFIRLETYKIIYTHRNKHASHIIIIHWSKGWLGGNGVRV